MNLPAGTQVIVPVSGVVAFLLGLAAKFGLPGKLGRWLASKIKPVSVNTGHVKFDNAVNVLGAAVEQVLKDELSGPLLDKLDAALLNGGSAAVFAVLSAELPGLKDEVMTTLEPAVMDALRELLGADPATAKKASDIVAARAQALVAAHIATRQVVIQPDGTRIVVPFDPNATA
jgi:hypothetical protein